MPFETHTKERDPRKAPLERGRVVAHFTAKVDDLQHSVNRSCTIAHSRHRQNHVVDSPCYPNRVAAANITTCGHREEDCVLIGLDAVPGKAGVCGGNSMKLVSINDLRNVTNEQVTFPTEVGDMRRAHDAEFRWHGRGN
jgi:hypothetical protein